ncbi:MAG: hypothetical protein FGM46_01775 [Ferruginibacter sp.]|nr:hypothetical protein [Ferruginibacter sp.]
MKRIFIFILIISSIQNLFGQSKDTAANRNAHFFSTNGYVKDMHILNLPVKKNPTLYGNLLHNRLNIKFDSKEIKAAFEMRNRLWWNYAYHPDLLMSIERLWMEYKAKKISVKVGRQRINWGMNNTWNPNDIFNSYNLFDFDYEERAGIDGMKIRYQRNDLTSFEFGISKEKSFADVVMALKYNFNIAGFDWQCIGGMYKSRPTIGVGWQGSISNAGFKGEIQHFFGMGFSQSNLIASVEFDYITSKG